MGLSHSPGIIKNGLVLYLDAANRKSYPGSGTAFYDLSKNMQTATITGSPTFNTYNNGTFTFDGTDRYISGSMVSTPSVGSDLTMESVVKLNSVSGVRNVFNIGRSGSSFSCGIVISGTGIRFRNSTNDHAFSSPSTLTTGVWYHLIISCTAGATTGYVNGISQGTTAQVITTNAILDYYISRRSSNSATEQLDGDIAMIKVYYNKALTQEEVSQNFNALRGRYGI